MDLFVTRAASIAHDVEAAESSRAFRAAVQDFEHLLSRIAHYPSDFLTDGDARALASIADLVVNRIEDRLDAHADRGKVQIELARQIYQVRRDLESIYMMLRDGEAVADLRA
ncbi:MAG TPA: hypothetical protein VFT24_10315 [Vicinamibacterales bacterium]|nr:hypothetical protein [Vicinamibacterales bacterium]